MRIKNLDPKDEIKKTCKISIEKLETTNKEIQRRSTNSNELFICRLKMELESDNIENNFL